MKTGVRCKVKASPRVLAYWKSSLPSRPVNLTQRSFLDVSVVFDDGVDDVDETTFRLEEEFFSDSRVCSETLVTFCERGADISGPFKMRLEFSIATLPVPFSFKLNEFATDVPLE